MDQGTASFAGRSVVVTGGAGALGMAVVEALTNLGAVCHVPCLDRTPPELRGGSSGSVTVTGGIDLSDESSVREYFAGVAELGPIWASLHIAGGFDMGPITETDADRFDAMIACNARTCFLCCREATVHLRASGVGGRIVNVAAMPGLEPRRGGSMVAYTASKAAVAAITQSLATELAGDSIFVNAVAPGIMDTQANRDAMPDADFDRWTKVDEVAATIRFLASPDNLATTGGLVPVSPRG